MVYSATHGSVRRAIFLAAIAMAAIHTAERGYSAISRLFSLPARVPCWAMS
jgi:hypothetical protein